MSDAPKTHYKQVAEARNVRFNYGTKMNVTDTVSAVVGITAPGGITVSAPVLATPLVTALVSGGTVNTTYRLSCLVTTTQGETLELDVNVRVADGVN